MLLQQIDRWATLCPQRIVHQSRDESLTYAELKTYSDALAHWILRHVVSNRQPQVPIIVYGHKEAAMLVLFLACIKSGHPYIPIDISVPPERLQQIVVRSGAAAILSPRDIPDLVVASGIVCQAQIHLPEWLSGAYPPQGSVLNEDEAELPELIGYDDVWYIIFTSGSTGEPKGVQITQRALATFLDWVNREYTPRPQQEVFLNQAPFSFDLSVMDVYMALTNGGTLWSVDQTHIANPRELFQSLAASDVSYWVSTPSFAEMCLLDRGFTAELMPQLSHFLFCGEVLPNAVAAGLLQRFAQADVINMYGPTECTVAVSGVNITPDMAASNLPLPVGQSIAACQIYICEPEGRTVLPSGVHGEIVIVGPNVSIGYLHQPELTERVFLQWQEGELSRQAYRTGDIGYWQDGLLYYQGRRDFQVKLHGYRIELGEIEAQLRQLPEVENAVVIPIVRRGKNAALEAYIALRSDPVMATAVSDMGNLLRQKLSQVLPAYMLPQRYTFISSIPLTANGKADRNALRGGKYDPIR